MMDDDWMNAGWVTEEETEFGKKRRCSEENMGWKMKKDAGVRNAARIEARRGTTRCRHCDVIAASSDVTYL